MALSLFKCCLPNQRIRFLLFGYSTYYMHIQNINSEQRRPDIRTRSVRPRSISKHMQLCKCIYNVHKSSKLDIIYERLNLKHNSCTYGHTTHTRARTHTHTHTLMSILHYLQRSIIYYKVHFSHTHMHMCVVLRPEPCERS